jgi:galactose mutarotase-like enzyme
MTGGHSGSPNTMSQTDTVVLESGATRAVLAPWRGGMLTSLVAFGREIFYLDEATLRDPTKNVRGGNPVLFPSPGPLAGDRFTRGGREGVMKQHGLARQRPWTVAERTPSAVTLGLASDASTAPEMPWAFALSLRYELEEGRVRMTQRVENRDAVAMPYALGFHPYFLVPDAEKGRVTIPTRATRGWDNVAKREVAVAGPVRIDTAEIDLHLKDHGEARASLELGDGSRIVVSGSPAFARWVIWAVPGKDFVCLEPWTAPANALNTGEGLRTIAPGGADELVLEVAFSTNR